MNKKTKEHAASVIKEIRAEVKDDVFRDQEILRMCDVKTGRETGFVVMLKLKGQFEYPSALIENWRRRLEADSYTISVVKTKLRIRFYVNYSEDMQEP